MLPQPNATHLCISRSLSHLFLALIVKLLLKLNSIGDFSDFELDCPVVSDFSDFELDCPAVSSFGDFELGALLGLGEHYSAMCSQWTVCILASASQPGFGVDVRHSRDRSAVLMANRNSCQRVMVI